MSGYIETGYIAAVGTLSLYGLTLLRRERSIRRRLTRHGIVVGASKGRDNGAVVTNATPADTTEQSTADGPGDVPAGSEQ